MDQRERLRAAIDQAESDLIAKVNTLEDRARELKHRIRSSVDLDYQTREHPWAVFGAALATGLLVGWISGRHSD